LNLFDKLFNPYKFKSRAPCCLHCFISDGILGVTEACAFLLHFWLLGELLPSLFGLIGFGNRPDRFGGTGLTGWCLVLAHVQGEYAMCRESSCMLWWFMLFALACFLLGCVESWPLPKGTESFLFQVILLFAFVWSSIACLSIF
jgi:hypothetical protein